MDIYYIVILVISGLVGGSFLGALTYRLPKEISIKEGRSFCPKCHAKISWYDNIPLLFFIFLGGKCRSCKKKISFRYPLIELLTASTFLFVGLSYRFIECPSNSQGLIESSAACFWSQKLGTFSLPAILVFSTIITAVFIIDLEHQIILDDLIFPLYIVIFVFLVFNPNDLTYSLFLSSFAAASFLLLLHLVTKGRGMGLGDVKLALVGGIILGWPHTLVWMFLSFLIGAIMGVLLIILGKAKFKVPIPFGSFLAFSLVVTFFWGQFLLKWFRLV